MGQFIRAVKKDASRRVKPAQVRFYFDADILGLGKLVSSLRHDCTFPTDPGAVVRKRERGPCSITRTDTPDDEWIPQIARDGLLIITRDSKIQQRVSERKAVQESAARLVVLSGSDAKTVWGQLEVLMSQWRRIEALYEATGPFIKRVTRTRVSTVEFD